jgi:hypothetical protein
MSRRVGQEMFTSRIIALHDDRNANIPTGEVYHTRKELADYYNVSVSTVGSWIRGESQPRNPKTRKNILARGKRQISIRKGEATGGRMTIWLDNRIAILQAKVDLAKGAEKKSYQQEIDDLNNIKNGDLAELIEAAKHNRTDKDWDEWRGDYETIRNTITSV